MNENARIATDEQAVAKLRRRADALLRLAMDPAATDAERTLAAAKAAAFLRRAA